MVKKINTKLTKLIKYYSLINHNLIYENEAINRYKINNNLSIKGPKGIKLQELKNSISKIENCELKKSSTNIVFSDGNPNAKIMIIGEGPGANEDLEGVPFIGRTGELLDKMLLSINLDRDNVYISNVVNYRPPENRNPTEEEISRYLPYLKKHIEIINPQILILLGGTALNAVLGKEKIISNARGKWIEKKIGNCNTSVIASFHPAFLMRQPDQKKLSWADLKIIRKKISDLKINIGK
ncbi:uracil-DNA glycosylase [Pelagibacteraceae bacterium]|jgi:uracil-DNA glycosylase family 4|nr:uracil-DNA glycosylase [Pelagibacteraceae bacterium]